MTNHLIISNDKDSNTENRKICVSVTAMSHTPKSNEDLASLYNLAISFLEGFERLYVHGDPTKVSRCRLCIWQLIHVPVHIAWNGSISTREKKIREHLYQALPIKRAELEGPSEYYHHLAAICDYLKVGFDIDLPLHRWGKCIIPGDVTLRSKISELRGQASRSCRYFEAQEGMIIFGEALEFYFLPEHGHSLVVYHKLVEIIDVYGSVDKY
jgi:hypothetical protein